MPNDDGTFSVYLRADRDRLGNLDAWCHELMHIEAGELEGDKDVREVEA